MPDAPPIAAEIVDAINDVSGRHEGARAVHAKGTLLAGTFTGTPEGAALSRAAHLQGEPVRATVRLSNGSGDPEGADYAQDGRGLAVKLYLPDGSTTDTVAITLPVFFVRTPDDFLAFTRARKPDPQTGKPDLEKLGAYLEHHPEALPAIQAALSAPRPASYAQCLYNGIHAFRVTSAEGESRMVRYSWEPEAGEAGLEDEEAKERETDYLQEEILERIAGDGAAFRLAFQLAEEGDPIDDPTQAWPEQRERVVAGRLELTGPEGEREREGDILVFDPTRVADGVECSDDQILRIRSHAYAESVLRRTGVARA